MPDILHRILARKREEIAERAEQRPQAALERAAKAEERYREAEAALTDLGRSESSLDADHEEALAAAEALDAQLAQYRAREVEAQRARTGVEARVDALRLLTERRDGAATLLEDDPALRALSGLITIEEGWETAVAAALGAAAEAVVVADVPRAGKALRDLSAQELGRATLLVSSHQPRLVARHVDRIIALDRGRISFDGPPAELHDEALAGLYEEPAAALEPV